MNQLIIFGCGGHARSVIDIALLIGWDDIIIIDEKGNEGEVIFGFPIYSSISENELKNNNFFVAIGDNYRREKITHLYQSANMQLINIISPHAYISKSALLKKGVFIGNFAHIGPSVSIGDNVIINTHSIIEHECCIGSNTHVAIGAQIAGRVTIGDYCMVGAGASIRDNITIGNNVIIGAGAVVVNDINLAGTYVGNPVRKIK